MKSEIVEINFTKFVTVTKFITLLIFKSSQNLYKMNIKRKKLQNKKKDSASQIDIQGVTNFVKRHKICDCDVTKFMTL